MSRLKLAIESHEEVLSEHNTNTAPQVLTDVVTIDETRQVLERHDADISTASAAIESLIEASNFIHKAGSSYNYTANALALNAANMATAMTGARASSIGMCSLEDFENNQVWHKQAALESFGQTINNIWERIKAFFRRIWDWLTGKAKALSYNQKETVDYCNKVIDKLKDGDIQQGFKPPASFDTIFAYRQGDWRKNVAKDAVGLEKLHKVFLSSQARTAVSRLLSSVQRNGITFFISDAYIKSAQFTFEAVSYSIGLFTSSESFKDSGIWLTDNIFGGFRFKLTTPLYESVQREEGRSKNWTHKRAGSVEVIPSDRSDQKFTEVLNKKVAVELLELVKGSILKTTQAYVTSTKDDELFKKNSAILDDVIKSKDKPLVSGEDYITQARTLMMFYGPWVLNVSNRLINTCWEICKVIEGGIIAKDSNNSNTKALSA